MATEKARNKARVAYARAQGQHVYISGIQGHHTLETGVAYHYRGHFLYACPVGVPIEPVPYSTSKGINIVGTIQDSAPRYEPDAHDLVPEASIAALTTSQARVWAEQKEQEEQQQRETARIVEEVDEQAVDEETAVSSRSPLFARAGSQAVTALPSEPSISSNTALVPPQVVSRLALRGGSDTSVGSLAVPNVPSITRESSPSPTVLFHPSSQRGGQTLWTTAGEDHEPSSSASVPYAFPRIGHEQRRPAMLVHDTRTDDVFGPSIPDQALLRPYSLPGSSISLLSLNALNREDQPQSTTSPFPTASRAPSLPSIPAYAPQPYLTTNIFTPHDRARFLSDSAPGSRLASRSASPAPPDPQIGLSSLRHIASTSHLSHHHFEDNDTNLPRTYTPLAEVLEGINPLSALRGRPIPFSETNSVTEDWIDDADDGAAFVRVVDAPRAPSTVVASPPYSRNKPIGTGRPRRASMALNQAYNAANAAVLGGGLGEEGGNAPGRGCVLHGEECDGVTVSGTWRSQRARETSGFMDLYPVVEGDGGRRMVDWFKLLREEQEKLK
ncbi:hypothetical protein GQ44DRAFT_821812 [Phaeosphaeriaceae sp. PMI808]|nr:hypothetical protein GQ44DRAFT_821812 [Phaeosphaeriaceae sp. PMI808]